MELCEGATNWKSGSHDQICYHSVGRNIECPLCEARELIEEQKAKIEELEEQVKTLENEVRNLVSEP